MQVNEIAPVVSSNQSETKIPTPATPQASLIESARMQVNAATFMTAMILPVFEQFLPIKRLISGVIGGSIKKISEFGGWGLKG